MRIERHCSCGASFVLTGPESRRKAIEQAAELLFAGHEGDGHKPTDRGGAREARKNDTEIKADVRL